MGSEWLVIPVSQVAEPVLGGTPRTDTPDYWGGPIPWATAKDIAASSGRYVLDVAQSITEKGLAQSAAKVLPRGTVVITARGTVGAIAQLGVEMAFNQTCYGLVPGERIDQDFLYYALKSSLARIRAISYGTVFDTITKQSFDDILIPFPSGTEQRAIAHILGTLDDKIELNRRMNETLEAMAQALFKSWFVDFDPVRAKMEGRWRKGESLPGLPAQLYDLFPDSFVVSELGEIPRGWEVKKLGELLELAYGKALKADNRQRGNVPVYGSNGQVGWHNEKLVTGPAIIVGRKGNPGVVKRVPTDCFPIDTTFYVVPTDRCRSLHFLFYALKLQDLASLSADSAVPGLNRNLAYMSKQIVSSRALLDDFDSSVHPLFQRIYEAEKESRTLAALRDALLPKLISGEVRVKDAEKFLKDRGL